MQHTKNTTRTLGTATMQQQIRDWACAARQDSQFYLQTPGAGHPLSPADLQSRSQGSSRCLATSPFKEWGSSGSLAVRGRSKLHQALPPALSVTRWRAAVRSSREDNKKHGDQCSAFNWAAARFNNQVEAKVTDIPKPFNNLL